MNGEPCEETGFSVDDGCYEVIVYTPCPETIDAGDSGGGGGDTSGGDTSGNDGVGGGGSSDGGDSSDPEEEPVLLPLEEFREERINNLLLNDPYLLLKIDCNQIIKWQNLAQAEPSQEIIDKINALQANNTSSFDSWAIQTLNDAEGTIVNMDYFAVNVTDLPVNPVTGTDFTPEQFLNYFRRNINGFAEGSTFDPYCEIQSICQQEIDLWQSNDPTGSIVYIDIPGDDGAVICSEFATNYWHFMTLEAPGAGNHPVSGTRQFGFEPVLSTNGTSYNFFVRGVDRFDNNLIENGLYMLNAPINPNNPNPFFGADALWESFQNKINSFINENDGTASIVTPVKNRPDWNEVMEVLEGKKPISDLGCN